jgi:hypothetical protein
VEQFLFPSYLAGKKIQENVQAACGCWNQRKSFFFVRVPITCHVSSNFSKVKKGVRKITTGTFFFGGFMNLPRFYVYE